MSTDNQAICERASFPTFHTILFHLITCFLLKFNIADTYIRVLYQIFEYEWGHCVSRLHIELVFVKSIFSDQFNKKLHVSFSCVANKICTGNFRYVIIQKSQNQVAKFATAVSYDRKMFMK
jgi:hypothetical protein